MKAVLDQHPQVVDNLIEAVKRVGLEPVRHSIRGGTDGSRLSFMGLPCPNLPTGGMNYHGRFECITVQSMDRVVEALTHLVRAR